MTPNIYRAVSGAVVEPQADAQKRVPTDNGYGVGTPFLPSATCHHRRFANTIVSWTDPRVEVRTSAIAGRGGFARELIGAGEIVVVMGGKVFTEAEFIALIPTVSHYDAIQIGEDLHLVDLSPDPRAMNGSLTHSCDSNLWMQDEVTLVARRDILPGEEITVDYALFTALPDWVLDLLCRCGASVCRHTITGSNWRLPDVQARYCDYFSTFLNARIARL